MLCYLDVNILYLYLLSKQYAKLLYKFYSGIVLWMCLFISSWCCCCCLLSYYCCLVVLSLYFVPPWICNICHWTSSSLIIIWFTTTHVAPRVYLCLKVACAQCMLLFCAHSTHIQLAAFIVYLPPNQIQ